MFTRTDLGRLIASDRHPAVSLYMSAHPAGPDIRQDPIRLKNLVAEAAQQLAAVGLRRPDAESILAPASALVDDGHFWRFQSHGLAVFLNPDGMELHKLPLPFEETVRVGPRFHVKPLLPVLAGDGRYFLLAVERGSARLFEGSKDRLFEVDARDMPESWSEVVDRIDFDDSIHFHPTGPAETTTGTPSAKYHALGDSPDDIREMATRQYLHRLANAVTEYLRPTDALLLVAAEPRVHGHFRAYCKYRRLHEDGLLLDPSGLDARALHERAHALLAPVLQGERQAAFGRYRALAGDGDERATSDVDEIVAAAHGGRIDTLFLAEDGACWGRFDSDTMRADTHRDPQAGDEDLLDLAAAKALSTGAQVFVATDEEAIPRHAAAAAILRY